MHIKKLITFIIPTCGRVELLSNCIQSLNLALSNLGQQDLSEFQFKAKVIFNGETTRALDVSSDLLLDSISVEKMKPSEARNRAIKQTKTDYFYFIDDDTQLPEDFLIKVCAILRRFPDTMIFGGPDNCLPGVSILERSLELALRSPLTTQKTNKRHTPRNIQDAEMGTERNLILCNLCVHFSVFANLHCYFPESYQRNEENVFLSQLENKVKIHYFAHLYIFHNRRPALKNVFYAASRSGYYRMRMILEGHGKNQFIFLIPAAFFVYMLIAAIALLILKSWILLIPLVAYLSLNILSSAMGCIREKKPQCFMFVCGYQVFIVLSYALGTIGAFATGFKAYSVKKFSEFG